MFFVFHILVFIILQISKTNNLAIGTEVKPDGTSLPGNEKTFNFQDAGQRNKSIFSTHKTFFQIIQNLTKTKSPNLKSNVFDKMLSDEMFSIKQHFHEKDMTYSSYVYISTQNNVPTPTLEVKQKWSLAEFMSKLNGIEDIEQYAEEPENVSEIVNKTNESDKNILETNISDEGVRDERTALKVQQNKSKVKILDLRSLPESTLNPIYYSKVCTCIKTNAMTCTHLCTSKKSKCTRYTFKITTPCPSIETQKCPKCTSYTQYYPRTLVPPAPISVYPPQNYYVPYQPYVLLDSMDMPNKVTYYHPNIFNELKIPVKPKRRKTTRRHKDDYLYYDNNNSEEELFDDFLENNKHYTRTEEPIFSLREPKEQQTRRIVKLKPIISPSTIKLNYSQPTEANVIYTKKVAVNVDMFDDTQNKFVNEIVNDLKTYYGDTVIKNCYCSRSLQVSAFRGIFLWMCTLFSITVWFRFCVI